MINGVSLNNRLILEPYTSDRTVKSTVGGGFALIQQKVSLKGLKVLMDANFERLGTFSMDGITTPKMITRGSIAYIREELLFTQEWAKRLFECEGVEGKFMIVDIAHVDFIDYK